MRDGVCAWTRADRVPLAGGALRQDLDVWRLEHAPYRILRRMGFSCARRRARATRLKGRRSAGALQKRDLRDIADEGDRRGASLDKRNPIQLWFQDEARDRQQGPECVTGGGAGASVPPGRVKSATSGPIILLRRCARTPATIVTLVMPSAKVMDLSSPHTSPIPWTRMRTAVMMCDGAVVGTTSAPRSRPSPTTPPWRCCRLTVPNSTPSSGFGSTYANASYRSAVLGRHPRPSSTPVAKHGSTCIAEPDRMRTPLRLSMDPS